MLLLWNRVCNHLAYMIVFLTKMICIISKPFSSSIGIYYLTMLTYTTCYDERWYEKQKRLKANARLCNY